MNHFCRNSFLLRKLSSHHHPLNKSFQIGSSHSPLGVLPIRLKSVYSSTTVNGKNAETVSDIPKPANDHVATAAADDPFQKLDLTFENAKEAYKSKSTPELLRALLVFKLCSFGSLVDRNKELMKWSRKLLGKRLFTAVMKGTFYGHFVAGEDQEAIKPGIEKMRRYGVKSILDYSAEEDVSTSKAVEKEREAWSGSVTPSPADQGQGEISAKFRYNEKFADRRQGVQSAKVYFYEGEDQCDKNMKIFLDCIDAVSGVTGATGFAAIKLTALGRPQLLNNLSEVLIQTHQFFEKHGNQEGNVEKLKEEAKHSEKTLGVPVSRTVGKDKDHLFKWVTLYDVHGQKEREIDLLEWGNLMSTDADNFARIFTVPNLKTGKLEPLKAKFTHEELTRMKNMIQRLNTIAEHARNKDVRVMIDAEQSYFQPAIRRLTLELMRKFNQQKAIIFNTYQCYLKDANKSVEEDIELSLRYGFFFGAKLVRGAYMDQERKRAQELKYPDPIHPSYDETNKMYERVLTYGLQEIKANPLGRIALMVASHNEDTVRFTVNKMKEFNIHPNDRVVCFGQLLGMCDQVSYSLGQAGFSVYKYVPYGPVEEVLPYLSRRALENKSILRGAQKERRLLWKETKRRLLRM